MQNQTSDLQQQAVVLSLGGNEIDIYQGKTLETLVQESKEDAAKIQAAQRVLKGINGDYEKLAKKIAEQNKSARNLMDSIEAVKTSEGLTQTAKALGGVVSSVVQKVPVIGWVPEWVTRQVSGGDSYLHVKLEEQHQLATQIVEKLNQYLYAEDGLLKTYDQLKDKIGEYTAEIIQQKKAKESIEQKVAGIKPKIEEGISFFETKYGKKLDAISPSEIDGSEETERYLKLIKELDSSKRMTSETTAMTNRISELSNLVMGERTLLGATEVCRALAEDVYAKATGFLSKTGDHIPHISKIAQVEQVLARASTTVTQLQENYNQAILMNAKNASKLAHISEDLVPKDLHNVGVLVESVGHLVDAARTLSEKQGYSALEAGRRIKEIGIGQSPIDKPYKSD